MKNQKPTKKIEDFASYALPIKQTLAIKGGDGVLPLIKPKPPL